MDRDGVQRVADLMRDTAGIMFKQREDVAALTLALAEDVLTPPEPAA